MSGCSVDHWMDDLSNQKSSKSTVIHVSSLLDDRTAMFTRITRGYVLLDVGIFIDVRLPKANKR